MDGRYRIVEILGRGANGTTYRVEHVEDAEVVALKELLVRNADSLKTLEAFEREARTLEQLDHPAIPTYVEDFTVELGATVGMYLAQEFVDGEPLSNHLEEDNQLDPIDVLRVIRGVAEVLVYLRQLSPPVVHRDIKPHNIIRRRDGSSALIDFGAVQDAVGTEEDGVPTMAGTVGYMAPEQLLGHAEPASDVHGLGVTAIALLAGKPAVDALSDRRAWSDGLPDKVLQVVNAMTARHPANRPGPDVLVEQLDSAIYSFEDTRLVRTRKNQILSQYDVTPRPLPTDFMHSPETSAVQIVSVLFIGALLSIPFAVVSGLQAIAIPMTLSVMGAVLVAWKTRHARRRTELYQHGAMVVGSIDGAVNVRSSAKVHYSYDVDGERYRGSFVDRTAEFRGVDFVELYAAGEDIVVFYEPQRPSRHRPLPQFLHGYRLT